jgi:hypothetical protein
MQRSAKPGEPGSRGEPNTPFGGGGDRSGASTIESGRRKPGRPPGQAPISDEQASGELTGLWEIPWDARGKEWDRQLRKDYGLPGYLWWEIAEEQGHRCPLCLTPMASVRKRFPLDHDHDPDSEFEVFGLPCDGCNRLLDSEFRARLLAYLTDPPARRVGMRLYGRPLRVPRVRAVKLEAKRAKRAAASRSGSARTTRAASRVRRARQAAGQVPAGQAAGLPAGQVPAGVPAGVIPAQEFGAQLDALMGRAVSNQASSTTEGRF